MQLVDCTIKGTTHKWIPAWNLLPEGDSENWNARLEIVEQDGDFIAVIHRMLGDGSYAMIEDPTPEVLQAIKRLLDDIKEAEECRIAEAHQRLRMIFQLKCTVGLASDPSKNPVHSPW